MNTWMRHCIAFAATDAALLLCVHTKYLPSMSWSAMLARYLPSYSAGLQKKTGGCRSCKAPLLNTYQYQANVRWHEQTQRGYPAAQHPRRCWVDLVLGQLSDVGLAERQPSNEHRLPSAPPHSATRHRLVRTLDIPRQRVPQPRFDWGRFWV